MFTPLMLIIGDITVPNAIITITDITNYATAT